MKILVHRGAQKQLSLLPQYVYRKFLYWIDLLEKVGIQEARKYRGFHDELLRGERR